MRSPSASNVCKTDAIPSYNPLVVAVLRRTLEQIEEEVGMSDDTAPDFVNWPTTHASDVTHL